ncbi:MAG: hydantoinase B/oxoprolinase family protein [Limnohabitans sp.]|nr:hydantoinase B/oxoprolinase family protein [Limnohabitans sp.]
MNTATSPKVLVDPVTLEIIRNLFIAILDEGEINLSRTAFSPIIYEVKDYAIGLLDREGRTIAQSRGGVPTFMADLGEPVRDGLEIYGPDGFQPGDVLLINYSAVCGQHLNNMILYVPIHWEGKLIGFAATRAHWTDIGGRVSGSFSTDTTEIFQEGLQIRSVKVYKAGQADEEILRIIRHNIRFPELSLGDMAAQVAACQLTARRFTEMVAKHGWATIEACIHRIWDQSEALALSKIAAMPKGRFVAESFLDDDGINPDNTLPIKVAVTISDDSIEIDFTGTAPQTKGPMNSGRSGGLAAAKVAFKSAIVPNLPPNEGAFRPLKVVLPEGTMISAVDNAAMAHWNLALKTVIDTIYWALSQALPDQIPAAHHAAQGLYTFFGKDKHTGIRYSTLDTTLGGWGARPDGDGFSPLKTVTHGDTRNIPVEVEETFYPLHVESYSWRSDTGGAGHYRGGLGLKKVYKVLQDCQFVSAFERTKCPPWGLFGGAPGKTADAKVRQPHSDEVKSYRKVTGLQLQEGAVLELLSAGGGGRGNPFDRPIDRVLDDVRLGYVSIVGAGTDYGVAIDPKTMAVNTDQTLALRNAMRKKVAS